MDRHDERGRREHRNVQREKVREIETRPPHRQRQRDLFVPAEVAAVVKRLRIVLRRDLRQARRELACVGSHAGRELARRPRVESDARGVIVKRAFRAATAG